MTDCGCMVETDPTTGEERVLTHSLSCPQHPEYDVQPMRSTPVGAGVYEVLGTTHNCRVQKEFYADGPSLFEWVLYLKGDRVDSYDRVDSFPTKRAALQYCQEHPEL